MNALSVPKADFTALAANLPEMRQSFNKIMAERMARSAAAAEPEHAESNGEAAGVATTPAHLAGEGLKTEK
jgi:CRP-like cAMP-binding protein